MVFLYQRFLEHYRIPIFERLSCILGGKFTYIFGQKPNEQRHFMQDEHSYTFKSLKQHNLWLKGDKDVWLPFLKPFKILGKPDIIIFEYSPRIISLFPFMIYCKIQKIPFLLWGHGGSMRRDVVESFSIKDFIHRWIVKYCDAYICYTKTIRKKLSKITDPEKLFVANNTLDTDILFQLRKELESEGRDTVKKRLGLDRTHYICFIGRLVKEKSPDLVLEVLNVLQKTHNDIGAVFIGDGEEMEALKKKADELRLEDVHFKGSIIDNKLSAPYLYACDVLLNPGCVGLSVNHAFCFGLPVVTQCQSLSGPFHGPEAEFIEDGNTGYFVPFGDIEAMANAVNKMFINREQWYMNTIDYAEKHLSINKMIEGFREALDYSIKIKEKMK